MAFISGADLQSFCPNLEIETLDAIAKNVDDMFCDLLPLRMEERERSYEKWQVFSID